jgi:TRAP-type uncharacterized transport system fused permease subunit
LEKSGTGKLFMDFASAIQDGPEGREKSRAFRALFGTISERRANVMRDGWLTIPLMKRTVLNLTACAVEGHCFYGRANHAPVMGAAAFNG